MSDYRLALDHTSDTLAIRARNFRNLVVAFVVIGLASVGGVLAQLGLWPASGLLLLAPAYWAFLWRDSVILGRWRAQLCETWMQRAIDFSALRQALNANSTLPQSTVKGMLDTLPACGRSRSRASRLGKHTGSDRPRGQGPRRLLHRYPFIPRRRIDNRCSRDHVCNHAFPMDTPVRRDAAAGSDDGMEVHAYLLMTDHVHLLATAVDVQGAGVLMKAPGQRFVQYANRCYRRSWTLWG